MIALGIILAALILIALLRFGVDAEYGEDGFSISARVGFVSIDVFPSKPKKRRPKKKKKREKKPGSLKGLLELLPGIKKALGRLRRRLLIKTLTVHFTAAGADPAVSAITYGAARASFGVITAILENSFRIKKRDLFARVDFLAEKPVIYVNAAISLAVWEAVYIAFGILPDILKNTDRKEGKRHGKPSDRRANGNDDA